MSRRRHASQNPSRAITGSSGVSTRVSVIGKLNETAAEAPLPALLCAMIAELPYTDENCANASPVISQLAAVQKPKVIASGISRMLLSITTWFSRQPRTRCRSATMTTAITPMTIAS